MGLLHSYATIPGYSEKLRVDYFYPLNPNAMRLALSFLFIFVSLRIYAQPCKTIIGYYPGWQWYDRVGLVNPTTIDYSKYSIINYAFLVPTPDGSITVTDPWGDKNLLLGSIDWSTAPAGYETQYDLGNPNYHLPNTSLISQAHNADVKVMISLGGWTYSNDFPSIAGNTSKRTNFAHWCNEVIRTYGCDGIDLDWEYPGFEEHSGTPEDTHNYTLLIQEIRDSLNSLEETTGNDLLLTAAFGAAPARMEDIEWEFIVPELDFVNLMSYDFFGAFDSETNHNSPLFPPASGNPAFNLDVAVTTLVETYGVPSEKINAGVAFYGRSAVTAGIPGLHAASAGYADAATFSMDEGTPLYYNVLLQMGLFESHWDNAAHVPYLTGIGNLHTFVSYDNESSILEKAQYIVNHDLAGAIIWEITGDYIETSAGSGIIGSTPLADALNTGLCSAAFDIPDCENMCVTDISMNGTAGMLDVTIVNGNTQINYPIVMVVVDGDTLANQNAEYFLFAQMPGQTTVHLIPTTLTEIPIGFQCTVILIDGSSGESCSLVYPCVVDEVAIIKDASDVSLFPNPTFNELSIQSHREIVMVEVSDMSGRRLMSKWVNSVSARFSLNDIKSGSYLIEMFMEDGSRIRRKIEKL